MVFKINDIFQDSSQTLESSKLFADHKVVVLSYPMIQNLPKIALLQFEINNIFYFH